METKPKNTLKETLICPTWEQMISTYLLMYANLSREEKKIANEEIIKCAKLADRFVKSFQPNNR